MHPTKEEIEDALQRVNAAGFALVAHIQESRNTDPESHDRLNKEVSAANSRYLDLIERLK